MNECIGQREGKDRKMNTCQCLWVIRRDGTKRTWDRKGTRGWDMNASSDLKTVLLFLCWLVRSQSPLPLLTEGNTLQSSKALKPLSSGKLWVLVMDVKGKHCEV